MSVTIFDFQDYRKFIFKWLQTGQASQNHLAKAAGCHPSYLSTSLKGTTELTPDHAAGLCRFWAFSPLETEYFLELVHYSRAVTPELRSILQKRIQKLREESEKLSQKLPVQLISPDNFPTFYYSNWIFSAIHMAVSIKDLQTESAIASRLQLSKATVHDALELLLKEGLVEKHGDKWTVGSVQMHLPADSPWATLHHSHWRNQAIQNAWKGDPKTLHFTGVYSLSEATAEKLRRTFTELVAETVNTILPSKCEELYCFTLDWFEV